MLIGISAVILMLFNGRIAGISGILGRLFPPYHGADPGGAASFDRSSRRSSLLYGGDGHTLCANRFGQCGPDDRSRASRRCWRGLWRRLHQRPWRLRICKTVVALIDRHGDLHGNWICDGFCDAAPGGRLTMRVVINVLAGLIFGLGLLISGMANPLKVQNF